MGCGQGPGEGTGVGPVTLLPPCCGRRKRSYKQAVSELDEEPQLEDEEELQPPRSKTPSPPCPASKVSGPLPPLGAPAMPRSPHPAPLPPPQVVRPLRTFLHTVQRNQMLMTPTSAPRSSVMKSFIKRNTPLRVDPKVREPGPLAVLCESRAAWLRAPVCPLGRWEGCGSGPRQLGPGTGQGPAPASTALGRLNV